MFFCSLTDIPYKFDYTVIYKNSDENEFLMLAKELAEKYSTSQNRVSLCEQYGSSFSLTCLDKVNIEEENCSVWKFVIWFIHAFSSFYVISEIYIHLNGSNIVL